MAKKIRKRRANYFDGGGFSWQKGAGFGKNIGNAFNSGALNGAISAASSMAGQGISGGLSSGAGNAIQGLSSIASAIPGPLGAIAGAGLNIVGGLVNKAFGSQINEQAVQEAKTANTQQSNMQFAASNTADLLDQSDFGLLGSIKKSDIGKDGWFSNKAKNLTAELNRQREIANQQAIANFGAAAENLDTQNDLDALSHYAAYGGPLTMRYTGTMSPFGNTFDKGGKIHIKPSKRGTFTAAAKKHGKSVQAFASQVLANKENYSPAMVKKANFARNASKWKHAFGGNLLTNGAEWDNGLTIIGNGGTHEENPNEGVQMGMDAQGIPNLVEEGEVIFNDYVFSDRMKVPNNTRERLGLSKKDKNLTFAKAAKKLSKESEERPNDPISKNGLEHSLGILSYTQEDERFKKQMRNPEFRRQLMTQLSPQEQQYAHGGKLGLKYEGDGDVPQYLRRPDSLYDWSGIDTMFDNWSFNPSNLKGNLPYTRGSNTNIAAGSNPERHNAFTDYALSLPDTHSYWTTLSSKTGKPVSYLRENYKSLRSDGKLGYVSLDPQVTSDVPNLFPIDEGPSTWMPQLISEGDNIEIPLRAPSTPIEGAEKEREKEEGEEKDSYYPTWLRYAPIVGAAVGLGQNIFSKPDYSSSDAILNAANEAGRYTPVGFNPLGDYLTYRPFDRNYYINKLNAQSGAIRRAIVNQSAGNRATALAGLLAADYNAQGRLGDLARQAEEYNLGQRERVAAFNRGTNQFNSEMGLKAAMANQEAALKARSQRLSGVAQAMQVRDAVDARRGASMSANLTNFFNSLGDIGREAYSRNMIISNPALYYTIGSDGTISYKGGFSDLSESQQAQVRDAAEADRARRRSKAKGGYLTIKRR